MSQTEVPFPEAFPSRMIVPFSCPSPPVPAPLWLLHICSGLVLVSALKDSAPETVSTNSGSSPDRSAAALCRNKSDPFINTYDLLSRNHVVSVKTQQTQSGARLLVYKSSVTSRLRRRRCLMGGAMLKKHDNVICCNQTSIKV